MKTTSWYLKKSDGGVYGPVRLADLKDWVKDSRVAPEDQLSPDQKQWMPAPELASLEMNCLVRYGNGVEYGPVHVRALCELIIDGDVPPDEQVLDKKTSTTATACQVALRGLMSETSSEPASGVASGADVVARSNAEQHASLEASNAKLLAEIETRKSLEAEVKRLDTLRLESKKKLATLEQQASAAQDKVKLLEQKLAGVSADTRKAGAQTDEKAEARTAQLKKELADALAKCEQAERNAGVALKEAVAAGTAELKKQLEEERERNRKREANLQSRTAQFEGDLKGRMEDLVRSKQEAQAARQAAMTATAGPGNHPVTRSALSQVKARALARGTNIHAPRSPAQRAALLGRSQSTFPSRPPKRRPSPGKRS